MDALSAAVPMKIDLDVQLTVMAIGLYRLLAKRLDNGQQTATPRTLFRKFVDASSSIDIDIDEIVVTLGRRANNPLLLDAGHDRMATPLPWLGGRRLMFRFV